MEVSVALVVQQFGVVVVMVVVSVVFAVWLCGDGGSSGSGGGQQWIRCLGAAGRTGGRDPTCLSGPEAVVLILLGRGEDHPDGPSHAPRLSPPP